MTRHAAIDHHRSIRSSCTDHCAPFYKKNAADSERLLASLIESSRTSTSGYNTIIHSFLFNYITMKTIADSSTDTYFFHDRSSGCCRIHIAPIRCAFHGKCAAVREWKTDPSRRFGHWSAYQSSVTFRRCCSRMGSRVQT
jgi:hypothetical protein